MELTTETTFCFHHQSDNNSNRFISIFFIEGTIECSSCKTNKSDALTVL